MLHYKFNVCYWGSDQSNATFLNGLVQSFSPRTHEHCSQGILNVTGIITDIIKNVLYQTGYR